MKDVEEGRETIPGTIRLDPATGLPLASEQGAVLELIRAYLQLPYSIAEHGCGKKTDLVLDQAVRKGIPIWSLRRGMILERDMSPGALAEVDPERRPHRLLVKNPLCELADLDDPTLRAMLDEANADVHLHEGSISAGPYRLDYGPTVQFAIARSHIVPIFTFWDEERGGAVDLVVDPTLRRERLFDVEELRDLCDAPEALLFEAPLGKYFRLDEGWLTDAQRETVRGLLGPERRIDELSRAQHADLVRRLTGAEMGSIGDPESWSYANNVGSEKLFGEREEHDSAQLRETGAARGMRPLVRRLVAARVEADPSAVEMHREALAQQIEFEGVAEQIRRDAVWSERHLEPLARVAITMVYHRSLCRLGRAIEQGDALLDFLASPVAHRELRGLGVRQRRRIDRLAVASEDEAGRIDARALNEPYVECAIETIRQMNDAGLSVCIDRVGNVHGLRLDEDEVRGLRQGRTSVRELLRHSVVMGSHIDTVRDAGRFDGRLGVTAGVEIAHVIRDLEKYRDVALVRSGAPVRLLVTAFVGEEMSFTGGDVSMPGSAAVAGRAEVETVHEMRNRRGERFGDRLRAMLTTLGSAQAQERIRLVNDLAGRSGDELLEACHDPTEFFTPHSLERHIEQGPVLDRAGVPIALVDRIMGIHQEDLYLRGARAEAAALELDARLRELAAADDADGARLTVGIVEPVGDTRCHTTSAAFRCTLYGQTNHAGATPTADRRDAGVALGRLVRELVRWIDDRAADDVRPIVGDVRLEPGTDRNVVPGRASATLAVEGTTPAASDVEDLQRTLEGAVAGGLARTVARHGEGLLASTIRPTSFVNVARAARATLDLRHAEQEVIDALDERIDQVCREVERVHEVTIDREVQQHLPPQDVEETGQVLLIERSYGGSHNPEELELTMDLTRGCVLQLSVLQDVLARDGLDDVNLVELVDRHLPSRWRERLPRFVSGAVHDTCNIAARVRGARSAPPTHSRAR